MATYKLYLESGPMHKKTMVHVLDLLGCVANGPTTEEALKRTPHAIREYLRFLKRHGEVVDPEQEITTEVAEHITEGMWLGNGDPSILFPPDREPLTREALETYLRRLEWSRAEMLELVSPLSEEELDVRPEKGRPVRAILGHVLGAEYGYTRYFGKLDTVRGPDTERPRSKEELLEWMGVVRASELRKMRSLGDRELAKAPGKGKYIQYTHRLVRRMLEHEWEHLAELRERLT